MKVILKGSRIGRSPKVIGTLRALGLSRIGQEVVLDEENGVHMGMLRVVEHIVEIQGGVAPSKRADRWKKKSNTSSKFIKKEAAEKKKKVTSLGVDVRKGSSNTRKKSSEGEKKPAAQKPRAGKEE